MYKRVDFNPLLIKASANLKQKLKM